MFDKFSTGNFYLREQGTPKDWEGLGRIGEHTKNNKIQSPPLTRGGLGWGQISVISAPLDTGQVRNQHPPQLVLQIFLLGQAFFYFFYFTRYTISVLPD